MEKRCSAGRINKFLLLFLNTQLSNTWVDTSYLIYCRKQYVCHHSAFQKVSQGENKRGLSKNTSCKAKLNCKIKNSTRDTRKKDPYVKVRVAVLHCALNFELVLHIDLLTKNK